MLAGSSDNCRFLLYTSAFIIILSDISIVNIRMAKQSPTPVYPGAEGDLDLGLGRNTVPGPF
ncbi:hypothetical protein J25TS5_26500 [Paenibacillus faecis]|nr:hypothetical protein J25TS5_26500 [Paenibacillus faecis]